MPYSPIFNPPTDPAQLAAYVGEELRRIAEEFERGVDRIQLVELHRPPERPRDGMIVLADGTNWNPGSGAGFYGRRGGAWVLLG